MRLLKTLALVIGCVFFFITGTIAFLFAMIWDAVAMIRKVWK